MKNLCFRPQCTISGYQSCEASSLIHWTHEGPIRRPERGEWMGADKNSYRRRLKLQQDELARSDPQNHMLRTSTFRLPKSRSHWSATGPRNKHYRQPRLLHEHDSGNNSGAGWQEGSGQTGYRGRLDRLHLVTKKSSEKPISSTKTHHGFTNRNLWLGTS
jgi:hypothetical protein